MSKYHDSNTTASAPSGLSLNVAKLEKFKKNPSFIKRTFANFRYPLDMLEEHLKLGDSRAAIVLQTYNTLIVAAYTDELDCIALLEFPVSFVEEHGLEVGDRLLTVNTYSKGRVIAADLENGSDSYEHYNNFHPLIADFLSDDEQAIESRKLEIEENEWIKTSKMGHQKLMIKGIIPRNGSPYESNIARKIRA